MTDSQSADEIQSRPRVVIVGAGLAGLAAAVELAERGLAVTLLESRPRLGGRASSIIDRETGAIIDNCQHVSMGCCTNFKDFLCKTGCDDLFVTQPVLHFVAPPDASGRPSAIVPFRSGPWPAPLHLAGAFFKLPWFSCGDVLRIGSAIRSLAKAANAPDEPFSDWLARHGQREFVRKNFWHLVLVSALSESLERISLKHARKVFVDGFVKHRSGWEVSVPVVPLDVLYETRLRVWLEQRGVTIRIRAGVQRLIVINDRVAAAELRDGEIVTGDDFILAVPHHLLSSLLPDSMTSHPTLAGIAHLQNAAIASVHLWFDRAVTNLPHAVLLDRLSQWMFNRSLLSHSAEARPGTVTSSSLVSQSSDGQHLQVVISDAASMGSLAEADVIATVLSELQSVFPAAREATVTHSRVITEHRAVFSPLPHVDDLRPAQQSPIANLQLAGDWTRTGWPSTMEGATRSGRLAAANVLARLGLECQTLTPDLPASFLSRLVYGLRQ